ncbi:MAG: 3-hydroxyisobutyrate dehydrogenase [Pseudomonadota bacterium]
MNDPNPARLSLETAQTGFIGLGNMGLPMAACLARAGCQVKGYDLDSDAMDKANQLGLQCTKNAFEAIAGCDLVFSMLPMGRHVEDLYCNTVFKAAHQGQILVDCSTIDPDTSKKVAAQASEAGLAMLDAPVSGGVAAAKDGRLTFMVGGDADCLEQIRPWLNVMGQNIIHCGANGTGQIAKLCNNMMLAIQMISVSEGFHLARRLGLSDSKLFEVASIASGQCWSLTSYCPVPGPVPASPANHGYVPGFTAAMMVKDLKLATHEAHCARANIALGQHALKLYQTWIDQGGADVDFSGIVQMIEAGANGLKR